MELIQEESKQTKKVLTKKEALLMRPVLTITPQKKRPSAIPSHRVATAKKQPESKTSLAHPAIIK